MRITLIAALALLAACGGMDNPAGAGAVYGLTLTEPESGARIGDTLQMFAVESRGVRATATATGGYIPAGARFVFDVPTGGAGRLASSGDGDAPGNAVAHVAGVREGVTLLRVSLVDGARVLAVDSVSVRVYPVMRTVARDLTSGDSISVVLWQDGPRVGPPALGIPAGETRTFRFGVVDAQTGQPIPGRYKVSSFLDAAGGGVLVDSASTVEGMEIRVRAGASVNFLSSISVYVSFDSDRVPNAPHSFGFRIVGTRQPAAPRPAMAAEMLPPMMPGAVWNAPANGDPEHNAFSLHYLNRVGVARVSAMLTITPTGLGDRVRGGELAVGDTMTLSPYTVTLAALDTQTGAASFRLENTGHASSGTATASVAASRGPVPAVTDTRRARRTGGPASSASVNRG